MRRRKMTVLAMAAAASVWGASAKAEELSKEQLADQVRQLQAKVEALEARQNQSAADIDATVQRIIADADRRSQLMAIEGFTAGYDSRRGFVIQDAAGDFSLHPYFQFQVRHTANYRDGAQADGDADIQNGFEIRRMKFGFDGNMFGPRLKYKFQWASNRKDVSTTRTDDDISFTDVTSGAGTPVLEFAWVSYELSPNWAIRGGQFYDPLFHEQLVGSSKLVPGDRSLLNGILGANESYVQGVSIIYDNKNASAGPLRAELAVHDGFGSQNNDWQDPPVNAFNFGVSGRVEWMVIGKDWAPYADFSALGNKSGTDMLVLGGGFDWSENGDTNVIWHTLDAQWEPAGLPGFAGYAAYVGRYTQIGTTPAGADDSFYDWGFLVQASYLLNPRWEIFARYDFTKLDNDFAAAAITDEVHELTLGVNYYLKGHAAKFTADITYLPNGSPIGQDGLGILAQGDEEAQFVARIQFQLLL